MNGFTDHGLDESAFGEKKGFSEGIRSFDAFRKTPSAHIPYRKDAFCDGDPPFYTMHAQLLYRRHHPKSSS
jgi:hypothetical protein